MPLTLCHFKQTGVDEVTCENCGRVLATHYPPEMVHSACEVQCRHLGEGVRAVKTGCLTCEGQPRFTAAYACEIHGRALANFRPSAKQLETWLAQPEAAIYRLCSTCPEFDPRPLNGGEPLPAERQPQRV